MPSGVKIRPSRPERKNIGRNTTATISVAYTTELRISVEPLNTTSRIGSGFGDSRFRRNRRNTFSTSMIASSTTSPMAMARPPIVMELRLTPNHFNTITPANSDVGIARKLMNDARKFIRKMNRITVTMMPPSKSAFFKLRIEPSMKSAWRNTRMFIFTSGGN